MTHEAGKGDKMRPTDWDKFNANFEKIFGSKLTEKEKKLLDQPVEQPLHNTLPNES